MDRSGVQWGPRFKADEDRKLREMKAALEKKLDMELTDRMFLLISMGFDVSPIKMGPTKMVSHDVLSDSSITDSHTIEGLDSGAMQTRLLDEMRRRKASG